MFVFLFIYGGGGGGGGYWGEEEKMKFKTCLKCIIYIFFIGDKKKKGSLKHV